MKEVQAIKITPSTEILVLDLSYGNVFDISLDKNISLNFSNYKDYQTFWFVFRQDNTGGRTVTLPDGSLFDISSDPDSKTVAWGMSIDNGMYIDTPKKYASIPSAKFKVKSILDVSAVLNILPSEVCTVLWAVLPSASAAPTKEEIAAGTGATAYGTESLASSVNDTDNIPGLTANTGYKLYFYLVDAEDNESEIYTSPEFTTLLETPVITATADGTDTIDITWPNVTGNEGYEIEASDDGDIWETAIALVQDAVSYSETDLAPETTRYYRLKALGDGVDTFDSPVSAEDSATTAAA